MQENSWYEKVKTQYEIVISQYHDKFKHNLLYCQ